MPTPSRCAERTCSSTLWRAARASRFGRVVHAQTGELVWSTRTLTDTMHADVADGGASIVSDDGGDGPQPTLGHLQKITAACVCSAAGATVVGYACGWLLCMNTKVQ